MTELVELREALGGLELAGEAPATVRVSQVLWNKYVKAQVALDAVLATIEKVGQRPIYVTPDQEDAIRGATKPDAWIVVRESQVAQVSTPLPVDAPATAEAPVPPVSPMPLGRPPMGQCPARGGLPHTPQRYAYTEVGSVYYPGLKRVDGLCQCGVRIADVQCPHMKQSNDDDRGPRCRNCGKLLVSHSGVIDNRNLKGNAVGAPDPNVFVPIQPGSTEAPADAYRAPV